MPADDIQAVGVELTEHEEAPLEIGGTFSGSQRWDQPRVFAVGFGQIGHDGRAFDQHPIPILECWDFLARVEGAVGVGLGFAGSRPDGTALVIQIQLVERPVDPERAGAADAHFRISY